MFKKILGYFKYRNIIKDNYNILNQRYRLKFDKRYGRLYTVINVPEDRQEVLKTYGYEYLDNEVKKYISSIEQYFSVIGLLDLVSISKIDSLDPVNVLIVLRYKYKKHQILIYVMSGILLLTFSILIITGFIKLLLFLINFIMVI
jgi:hypothetical protein